MVKRLMWAESVLEEWGLCKAGGRVDFPVVHCSAGHGRGSGRLSGCQLPSSEAAKRAKAEMIRRSVDDDD